MKEEKPNILQTFNQSQKRHNISINYFGTPKAQARLFVDSFKKQSLSQDKHKEINDSYSSQMKTGIDRNLEIDVLQPSENKEKVVTSLQTYLNSTKDNMKSLSVIQSNDRIYIMKKPPRGEKQGKIQSVLKLFNCQPEKENIVSFASKSKKGYSKKSGFNSIIRCLLHPKFIQFNLNPAYFEIIPQKNQISLQQVKLQHFKAGFQQIYINKISL
eukprot:403347233